MKPTDVTEFLNNLNAGVFAQQVAVALSSVAAGVVEHGKKGKVTLSFDITQIGESHQVKTLTSSTSPSQPSAARSAKTPLWIHPCTSPQTAWSCS